MIIYLKEIQVSTDSLVHSYSSHNATAFDSVGNTFVIYILKKQGNNIDTKFRNATLQLLGIH